VDRQGAGRGPRRSRELSSSAEARRFCAFDLLALNGRDLRDQPLIERKRQLRDTLPECPQLLFVDHIEERGEELFNVVCKRDVEGIVAKHRLSRYAVETGNPAWVKIKN